MGFSPRQPASGVRAAYLMAALAAGLVFTVATAEAGPTAAQKCEAAKLKTSGKFGGCRGKSASKSVAKQVPPDYAKCDDKFAGGFAKADSKGGTDCPTSGDAGDVKTLIDACTDQIFTDLGGAPGGSVSKCTASKMKAVGKYYDCILKAESKAVTKGVTADLTKCMDKFSGAFGKAELKPPCLAGTGDAGAIKTLVDDCTMDAAEDLTGGPSFPDLPGDYVAEIPSYVDSLVVPGLSGGVPTCCKDFGENSRDFIELGTNDTDNALAELAGLIGGFVDINTLLVDAIAAGDLVLLFDHRDLDGGALPDNFTLAQLFGEFDNGTTPIDGAAGDGEFLITQSSFAGGTGTPISFSAATMADPPMTAGPFTLELTIPFGFVTLDLTATEAEIEGDPGTISAAGVPYTDGKIAGYVLISDIFAAINAILNSSTCDCLGLTSDVYTESSPGAGDWSGSGCVAAAPALCTDPDEEICVTLAGTNIPDGVCTLLAVFLVQVGDIDTDGNPPPPAGTGFYEGMSLGLEYTAQNAQINGVQP